jgi:hypothetical protein
LVFGIVGIKNGLAVINPALTLKKKRFPPALKRAVGMTHRNNINATLGRKRNPAHVVDNGVQTVFPDCFYVKRKRVDL